MKSTYKNMRLVWDTRSNEYRLMTFEYNEDGKGIIANDNVNAVMGITLNEVRENLLCLLSDIQNWEEEELKLMNNMIIDKDVSLL